MTERSHIRRTTVTNSPISFATELITPEIAGAWLERNYAYNRPIRNAKVEQFAAIMKAGRWLLTHQGIAWSKDNRVIDGQHRLWAIITSGVPVYMVVARNVDPANYVAIDQGIARSVSDLAQDKWVTPTVVGAARAMARGPAQGSRTLFDDRDPQLVLAFIAEHRAVLESVMAMRGGRDTRGAARLTSPVMGILARASYHVAPALIQRFVEVLMSGIAEDPGEKVIILLRDFLSSPASKMYGGKAAQYQKTQRALLAFLHGDPLITLYAMKDDQYPLPGKPKQRSASAESQRQIKNRGTRAP